MAKFSITHPDKIRFPKEKFTKGDVIAYYRSIAPKMLKFLKDRPLVMQRFPDEIKKEGFYQKNVPDYFPSWIKTVAVKREEKSKGKLVVCDTKEAATLVVKENPKLCTTAISKVSRRGRVYIDVMRNSYAQHGVAPYAIRALPGAPIAMPISWTELKKTDPQSFNLSNYRKRTQDPWRSFFRSAKRIATKKTQKSYHKA